ELTAAITTANTTLGAMIERMNEAAGRPDAARQASAWLVVLHDLRGDFNDAARILVSVRQANNREALDGMREQFKAVHDRTQAAIAKVREAPDFHAAQKTALATAAQNLTNQSLGPSGIFALREQYLRVRTSITTITHALRKDGEELDAMVATIVANAE